MRRDYKSVSRSRERPRGVPGWVWGFAGLALGLFVAFLVYLSGHRATGPVTLGPLAPASTVAPEPPRKTVEPAAQAPQKSPTPAVAPLAPKPRFEFYTMLPEMEVPVHEPAVSGRPPEPPAPARAAGETYVLQVGSFRTYEEADRLKASLSLIGLEASIQTVAVDGKPPIHRVRVGPYSDMARVNDARRRLREHSLEPILLKGKT
jgi:cell division protein FtsN